MHNFNLKYTKVSLRIVEILKSNLTAMDYLHNDKNKKELLIFLRILENYYRKGLKGGRTTVCNLF